MAAADLKDFGCPVFAAALNPRYGFNGDDREFLLPPRWQQTLATNVPVLTEDGALCLVTGYGVDVVDVDVKNGASVEHERAALIALGVVILWEVRTPSGGAHFYVVSTGICTSSKPVNGVDFRGGAADGSGRGCVFLPSTKRPRYKGAGYEYVTKPDTATAAELDLDEQRDAQWTYLQSKGIEPRLTATPPAEVAAGEPVDLDRLPERLRDGLSEIPAVGQRSERFYYAVALCKEHGYTQGQAVTLLTPWCAASGKFVGRVAAEVSRVWSKVDDPQDLSFLEDDSPPTQHEPLGDAETAVKRRIALTQASAITPRRTEWLWEGRMARGALSLVAGSEGTGKSTLCYWLVARVTRGELPGELYGQPRAVFVAATEDSWAHTIVPRLMAAGADLTLVYRVEVTTTLGTHGSLLLPADLPAMAEAIREKDAALLLLDPLTSRLSESLDTHKDSDTRRALEPLAAYADELGIAVIGLMHFNKSGSTNPMSLVMASKAFTAVARSVSTVVKDPEDESGSARLFGTPKNNLGRDDLPTLRYTISGYHFDTPDGPASTGKLVWGDDAQGSIEDALRRGADSNANQSATAEAAEWLAGFLEDADGCCASKTVKFAARAEGHSENTLRSARTRLGVRIVNTKEKPRRTLWALPTHEECQSCAQSCAPSRGDHITNLTNSTRDIGPSRVSQVSRVGRVGTGLQSTQLDTERGLQPACKRCGVEQPPTNPCPQCVAESRGTTEASA